MSNFYSYYCVYKIEVNDILNNIRKGGLKTLL